FVGSYHPDIVHFDLVAHEYNLFGDFACDLAVGDSKTKVYGFIEFEDAAKKSLFVSKPGKSSLEDSPRFEHGFSQVVDWFYKLDDFAKTDEFEDRFGRRSVEYFGLLVLGKDETISPKEQKRLKWRENKVIINNNKVRCMTFDQLWSDLTERLKVYSLA